VKSFLFRTASPALVSDALLAIWLRSQCTADTENMTALAQQNARSGCASAPRTLRQERDSQDDRLRPQTLAGIHPASRRWPFVRVKRGLSGRSRDTKLGLLNASCYSILLKSVDSAARHRPPVAKVDPLAGPGTAGRSAPQRIDRQRDLVAGFEALSRPPVAHQKAGAGTLEGPDRNAAVIAFDLQNNGGVRAGQFELLYRPAEL
jgi:hypothetical protein